MRCISKGCQKPINDIIWSETENSFKIKVRDDIKKFLGLNSGGYPKKDVIVVDGSEYEVRVFLSLDTQNQYYYIKKPLTYFLENTKGKIIPIGMDSGGNYYCVNNETGKVYFWSAELDEYYLISENLDSFTALFA